MRVLYLDIDGVLNSGAWLSRPERARALWAYSLERTDALRGRRELLSLAEALAGVREDIDPARAALVAELVRDTGAEVVLCSTWRITVGIDVCRALLAEHSIPVARATRHPRLSDHHPWYRRVRPILLDVAELPPGARWCVLDDEVPITHDWRDSRWDPTADGVIDIDHARCVTPVDGVTEADIERARAILQGGA